ncbi:MAG: vitamin K epoxide reductase family protein [Candidatus Saccharimonadales bacterium]
MAKRELTLNRSIGYSLAILGITGFIAALTLAIEKIELISNPSYTPSCNFSPLLSCGSVMNTPQAEVFGFPNPLIGIASFAIITTIGMAILSGAKFKRWFWLGLQAGTVFGVSFISWLYYQSVFNIGALCPYCMVVWSVTIPIFWYTTLYNISEGHIRLKGAAARAGDFMRRHHGDILFIWFAAGLSIILLRFWYYWSTLLS